MIQKNPIFVLFKHYHCRLKTVLANSASFQRSLEVTQPPAYIFFKNHSFSLEVQTIAENDLLPQH